jgi:hypothetical protein
MPCSALWRWGRSQFGSGSPAGGVLDQPVLGHNGVVAALLVLALAATAAGLLFRRNAGADVERWLWLAASALSWDRPVAGASPLVIDRGIILCWPRPASPRRTWNSGR